MLKKYFYFVVLFNFIIVSFQETVAKKIVHKKKPFLSTYKGANLNTILGSYYSERFEVVDFPPSGWSIQNADSDYTWEKKVAVSSYGIGQNSVFINFYNYNTIGATDTLKSPMFSELTANIGDSLKFDYAYGFANTLVGDTLIIALSTDGGNSFNQILFKKGGSQLQTATDDFDFVPTENQWKTTSVKLPSNVVGNNCVFAFITKNNFDNNLYIDNIRIGTIPTVDAVLSSVILPQTQLLANTPISIQAKVMWSSNSNPPFNFVMTYKENSIPQDEYDGVRQNFVPGISGWSGNPKTYTATFSQPFIKPTTGKSKIYVRFFIASDGDSSNNYNYSEIFATHLITEFPYFENFDSDSDSGWSSYGTNFINDWVKGTPSKTKIQSSYSAPHCWITKETGNYSDFEDAYVLSPIFDFRSLIEDPILSFYHNFDLENNTDGVLIEYDIDGNGFVALGNFADTNGVYWYNYDGEIGQPGIYDGPCWTRQSSDTLYQNENGWINSKIFLSEFAGIGKVQFRFRILTDLSFSLEGWAIDDINITFKFVPSTISGKIFDDLNSNGILDIGEMGISNWNISLITQNTTVTQSTNQNGDFRFLGLVAGNYTLQKWDKQNWTHTSQTLIPIQLDSAQNLINQNFGSFKYGSISGTFFYDANANGIREEDESALSNWKVRIISSTMDTIITANNFGNYNLQNILYDNYTISEILEFGYKQSFPVANETTFTLISGMNINLNFGNFLITSLSINVLEDEDGNFETSFDRTQKVWRIKFYKDSISQSTFINSVSDTVLKYTGNEGKFIVEYDDSLKWSTLGKIQNGFSQSGNYSFDTINVSGGTSNFISLVKFLPNKILMRNIEDLDGSFFATELDRIPKIWKLNIVAIEGTSTLDTTIIDSVLIVENLPKGKYAVSTSDSLEWTHLGTIAKAIDRNTVTRTKSNNDTITIGYGIDGEITFVKWKQKPDTLKFRTFSQLQLSQKSAKLKPSKKIPYPIPTYGNVRDSIFEKSIPKGTYLLIGISRKDSLKFYGWVTYSGGKGKGKTLAKMLPSTMQADSFKHKKEMKNPSSLKKINNKLFSETIALSINILGSDNEVTTSDTSAKFGDLFYEASEDSLTPYYGKTIREIREIIDTVLTYGKNYPEIDFVRFGDIVEKINLSFASSDSLRLSDTVSLFNGGLKLKGYKSIKDVPFLRRDLGIPPKNNYNFLIQNNFVNEFKLLQNFPNPFNPKTTISFSLANVEIVSLKIYDVLGREISALINNEEMESGTYEIDFDASNLNSGIYFYKLTTENFSEIKKLLLLK